MVMNEKLRRGLLAQMLKAIRAPTRAGGRSLLLRRQHFLHRLVRIRSFSDDGANRLCAGRMAADNFAGVFPNLGPLAGG